MPTKYETTEDLFTSKDADAFIIGVDPGVTTGVSIIGYRHSDDIPIPKDISVWYSDQFSYGGSGNFSDVVEDSQDQFVESKVCARVAHLVHMATWYGSQDVPVVLAIEDFIIRKANTSRDFLSPVRITAGILQEVYDIPGLKVFMQQPSEAKTICNNKRMDLWGYEIKTQKDRHSRDADRHAVLALRKIKENPRLLA